MIQLKMRNGRLSNIDPDSSKKWKGMEFKFDMKIEKQVVQTMNSILYSNMK